MGKEYVESGKLSLLAGRTDYLGPKDIPEMLLIEITVLKIALVLKPVLKTFKATLKSFDELWDVAAPVSSSNRAVIKESVGSASESFDDLVKQAGGKAEDIKPLENGYKSYTDKSGNTTTLRMSTDGDNRWTISQTGRDAKGFKIQKKIRFDKK